MDTIRRLTEQINVFVRFFESINCLFLQLRWLEENITRSNNGLLMLVFGITLFCIFVLFGGENVLVDICKSLGLSPEIGKIIYKLLPILLIIGIIALYLRRRQLINENQNQRDGIIYNAVGVVEEDGLQNNRGRVPEAVGIPMMNIPYPSAPMGFHNFGNSRSHKPFRY